MRIADRGLVIDFTRDPCMRGAKMPDALSTSIGPQRFHYSTGVTTDASYHDCGTAEPPRRRSPTPVELRRQNGGTARCGWRRQVCRARGTVTHHPFPRYFGIELPSRFVATHFGVGHRTVSEATDATEGGQSFDINNARNYAPPRTGPRTLTARAWQGIARQIWGMLRRVARPRTFDENHVIRSSREIFWSQGYAGTSLDDLADATGLGRGSLYNAFGDKHAIFLRSLDDYCAEFTIGMRSQLRGVDTRAKDRLVAHIRAVAAAVAADSKRRGCLMAKTSAELSATDPEAMRRVKRTMDRWQRELEATIAEAQRDGDITSSTDVNGLACLLLAAMRGFEALRKSGVGTSTITAAAEHAIAMLRTPESSRD